MFKNFKRAALLLTLSLGVSHCPKSPPPPVAEADFPGQKADAITALYTKCEIQQPTSSGDASAAGGAAAASLNPLKPKVYDAAKAQACLDFLTSAAANANCDLLEQLEGSHSYTGGAGFNRNASLNPCHDENIYVRQYTVKEKCFSAGDYCDQNSYCHGVAATIKSPGDCPAVCIAYQNTKGLECNATDKQCNPHLGLVCGNNNKCQELAEEGKICNDDAATYCKSGLFCNDASSKCERLRPYQKTTANQNVTVKKCETAAECKLGYICATAYSEKGPSSERVCTKPIQPGESCNGGEMQCAAGLTCVADLKDSDAKNQTTEAKCRGLLTAGSTLLTTQNTTARCGMVGGNLELIYCKNQYDAPSIDASKKGESFCSKGITGTGNGGTKDTVDFCHSFVSEGAECDGTALGGEWKTDPTKYRICSPKVTSTPREEKDANGVVTKRFNVVQTILCGKATMTATVNTCYKSQPVETEIISACMSKDK